MIRERYARFAERDDVPFGQAAAERARSRAGLARSTAPRQPRTTRVDLGGRTAEIVSDARPQPRARRGVDPGRGVLAAGDAVMGSGDPDARRHAC